MRIRRDTSLALFLCLAAIAIAGCGSGSDESAPSSAEPQALSTAQYIKQADAICQKANDRQEANLRKALADREATGAASKSEQVSFVTSSGLPPLKEEAADLRDLGAPAGEEKKAEALITALLRAIEKIEAAPLAFAEGKSTAFVPVERLARELRLRVCRQA